MRFDESRLDDFTGFFFVDSASNRFLNLTLVSGRGTIHGLVTGHNSSQAIQVKTSNWLPIVHFQSYEYFFKCGPFPASFWFNFPFLCALLYYNLYNGK